MGFFKGKGGSQYQRITAKRTHDLQPDRSPGRTESTRYRDCRLAGEIKWRNSRHKLTITTLTVWGLVMPNWERCAGQSRRDEKIILLMEGCHACAQLNSTGFAIEKIHCTYRITPIGTA